MKQSVDRKRLTAVARAEEPADLLLANGRILNLYSGAIEQADIAIAGDTFAGIGAGYKAKERIDLDGAYVAPGMIDAHVHIESSLSVPAGFAAAVLPRGITTAVIDPHEIANVAGIDGVRFMAEAGQDLALHIVVMAPSAVPATHMETSGAVLGADELAQMLEEGLVRGLGELMNFPGTVAGDREVLAKIAAFEGRPLDGHAPGLRGSGLNAYAAAGVRSEHEATTVPEAAEKLARGFYILIREATNARNLHNLLPLVNSQNSRRICFCTDDRTAADLLDQGSIDYMIREAIAYGLDPITVWRMATLNSAECYGLHDRGAIAPGRVADLVIFDDLNSPTPRQVYAAGTLVAVDGEILQQSAVQNRPAPSALLETMTIDWSAVNFSIEARSSEIRVIGLHEDQLVTDHRRLSISSQNGFIEADPSRDLLKMVVIERHQMSGAVGKGFVQGLGLKRGAVAGSVAHDHHNLVVIGADDRSMRVAAEAVAQMQGGLTVCDGDQILASMPLPIGGIMSDEPIEAIRSGYDSLRRSARELGSPLHDPFMAMSFLALEVIPSLKLTDQGLVDVEAFRFVELFT